MGTRGEGQQGLDPRPHLLLIHGQSPGADTDGGPGVERSAAAWAGQGPQVRARREGTELPSGFSAPFPLGLEGAALRECGWQPPELRRRALAAP